MKLKVLFIIFMVILAAVLTVYPDEVALKNGDKISGKITSIKAGKLELKPGYSNSIKISLSEVKSLSSNQQFAINLKGGQSIMASIDKSANPGCVVLKFNDGQDQEIVLVDIIELKAVSDKIQDKKSIWSGSVGAGGRTVRSDETDSDQLTFNAELTRLGKKNKFYSKATSVYDKTDDAETKQDTYIRSKYDIFLSSKYYAYINNELHFDKTVNEDKRIRTLTGGGLGMKIINQPTNTLEANIGLGYFTEYVKDGENDRSLAVRGTAKWKWFFSENKSISDSFLFYYLPDENKYAGLAAPQLSENKYQIRNELTLRLGIIKQWSLDIGHIWQVENIPGDKSAGISREMKTDSISFFTLQYSF